MPDPVPSKEELVELAWNETGVHPTQARRVLDAVLPRVLKGAVDALDAGIKYLDERTAPVPDYSYRTLLRNEFDRRARSERDRLLKLIPPHQDST